MNAPAPPRINHPPIGRLAFGWVGSVMALLIAIAWFSVQRLQNNGDYTRLDIWVALPELLGELVSPTVNPNPLVRPSGWEYLPERFDLMAVAGVILLFAWGWGSVIVERLFPRPQRPLGADADLPCWRVGLGTELERLYWSLVTGIAVWGTLTLLLGLCGVLSPLVFWVLGVVPAVIAVVSHCKRRKAVRNVCPTPSIWTGLGIACAIAIAPFLLAMLLGSLQPPNDFDVKEYHLEGAKEFYQRGRVEMLPHNVYTSFPFLTEMLCLSGMVLRGDWFRGALAGQAVLAAFAPLTALGLFVAARRWLGTTAAWGAVLVHLTCPWTYRISIIAYAEGGLACFLFATFFGACRVIDSSDPQAARRWTLLTGLLAGAAAGCKYPAVLTVVIPLGGLVVGRAHWPVLLAGSRDEGRTGKCARSTLRSAVLYTLGVLATFGPWLSKNLCETGNPVYPLLYSVLGGADWDDASNAKWKAGHPLPLKGISGPGWIVRDTRDRLWDVFLGSDWQSALYLALAVAAVFALWRSCRSVGFSPRRSAASTEAWAKAHATTGTRVLLLAVAYSLWLFGTWQYFTHRIDRFWVPMLPMLSLLAGAGLAALWESVEEFMPHRAGEVYAVLRGMIAVPVFAVVLFNLALATSPLGGNNSYLMELKSLRKLTRTPCIAFVESLQLAPTDKVLFVGEAEMFDAAFPYEYNTVFDHSIFEADCSAALPNTLTGVQPLRPAQEILDHWHARGITHVVVNWSEILRYRTTYTYTDFVHPSRFQSLVNAGVLVRDDRAQLGLFEGLASEKQAEVLRWAPELQRPAPQGSAALVLFEVYRVAQFSPPVD